MFKKQDTMDSTEERQSQTEAVASPGKALYIAHQRQQASAASPERAVQSLACTRGWACDTATPTSFALVPSSKAASTSPPENKPRHEGLHSLAVLQLIVKSLGKI